MIENSKVRLEDLPEGEQLPKDEDQKFQFPVAGVVIISSLVVLIVACIIVISVLANK